jgi:hypothetical protein
MYDLPKSIEAYCVARHLPISLPGEVSRHRSCQTTIGFAEAINRVRMTLNGATYGFGEFLRVRRLRDELEHRWSDNNKYLDDVVGGMSSRIIPCLSQFVSSVLKEEPEEYIDRKLLDRVDRLDCSLNAKRLATCQSRLDRTEADYAADKNRCRRQHALPVPEEQWERFETQVPCPVCGKPFSVWYEWVPDLDVETGADGQVDPYMIDIYPETRLAICDECHFFAEGRDAVEYAGKDIYPPNLGVEEPDHDDDEVNFRDIIERQETKEDG